MKKTYNPLQDTKYMSLRMKKHFEKLLKQELEEIRKQESLSLTHLQEHHEIESDLIDRSAVMSDAVNEIKAYEHYRREEKDIEAALRRLRDGYYGYCIETGEKIGVERLLAAPQASLCLEAQERKEKHNYNN